MRFQIPQAGLHEALRAVSRAAAISNSIPVLSGIYLCARGQQLFLRACDLELTIQMQVAAAVSREGDLVLPAPTPISCGCCPRRIPAPSPWIGTTSSAAANVHC